MIYLVVASLSFIFTDVYNERIGIVGLNYLALSVGMIGATQVSGIHRTVEVLKLCPFITH